MSRLLSDMNKVTGVAKSAHHIQQLSWAAGQRTDQTPIMIPRKYNADFTLYCKSLHKIHTFITLSFTTFIGALAVFRQYLNGSDIHKNDKYKTNIVHKAISN